MHDFKRRFSCYIAWFLRLFSRVYSILVAFPGHVENKKKSRDSSSVLYSEISLAYREHVEALHSATPNIAGISAEQLYELRVTRPSRMLVFVIEDHPLLRRVLEDALKRDNHVVVGFSDAEAALRWSDNVIPDAILTDVNLVAGRMTGVEFVRRHREKYGIVPVVFVTALPGIRNIVKYIAESCFITKPFLNTDITYALSQAEYWNRQHKHALVVSDFRKKPEQSRETVKAIYGRSQQHIKPTCLRRQPKNNTRWSGSGATGARRG
jgi:CheY-like chemotaxis protein